MEAASELVHHSQRDRVTAMNAGNDAMLELRAPGPAQGSPADALRKAIGGATKDIKELPINGFRAATATTTIRGSPTRAAVIFYSKTAFLIGAQAKTPAIFERALQEINASVMSFRAIGDAEREAVRPLTLRIINAPSETRFSELARNSPLGNNAVSRLRLLNGLYPSGERVAGQALKVVE